jgi:hypothetical protein
MYGLCEDTANWTEPGLKERMGPVDCSGEAMRRLSALIAVVMVASVACGGGEEALSDMQLREEFGTVVVVRDGEVSNVVGTFGLQPGDIVATRKDSGATFALEGGGRTRRVELQSETQVLIESPTSIEARKGEVLLAANAPTTARFDGVRATSALEATVFRIDRGFGSARAGVYSGAATLASPGQSRLRLEEFLEATVVAGDVPGNDQPYQMDVRDEWDAEHLGPYFELETQLRDLASGFTNQLNSSQKPGLDYFSALADGRSVGFLQPFLRRRPADLLIGFVLAQRADAPLDDAFEKAFDYYDQGARWGIVAALMGIQPSPILAQLEQVILGTGVAQKDGGEAVFTVAAAEAGGGSSDVASQPSDGANDPGIGDDPGGGEDPKDPGGGGDEEPPDECSDGAECDVEDVVQDVLGDDPPEPSPSPTDEEDQDDLLEGGLFD